MLDNTDPRNIQNCSICQTHTFGTGPVICNNCSDNKARDPQLAEVASEMAPKPEKTEKEHIAYLEEKIARWEGRCYTCLRLCKS